MQARDASAYDLEANLTLLKLYQFNPQYFSLPTVAQILLKALTNLPHSDFMQCKSLLSQENLEQLVIVNIQYLSDLLEKCQFKAFWNKVRKIKKCLSRYRGPILVQKNCFFESSFECSSDHISPKSVTY